MIRFQHLAQAEGAQPVPGAQLTRGIFSSYSNVIVKLSPQAVVLSSVELLLSSTLVLVGSNLQLQASGLVVSKAVSLENALTGAAGLGAPRGHING